MNIIKNVFRVAIFIVGAGLIIYSGKPVYLAAQETESIRYSKAELAQLLAPVALYPDSLLASVLMASTYPIEIVEAERWLLENKDLKGELLNEALLIKDWDDSIKSLCNLPDLIFSLSENIEQTRKLGDAFLCQEKDVMDMVQELRQRACKQGKLKTTKEQKVIVKQGIVKIEPVSSYLVYVPLYDPIYVYGKWMYPSYPPYCWSYSSVSVSCVRYVCFEPAISIDISLVLWTWFDWPSKRICVTS